MTPIRIGVLGVLAFVPASWALDEPRGAPRVKAESPQARFDVIQNEYQQALREFRTAYGKATTDDERQKAVESKYPTPKTYVPRMMELAESAPDDPAAVDALVWVVRFGGQTNEADRAIEHLARDHAQDPKVAQLGVRPTDSISPAAERLLRVIAEKSPDRAAQAQATFALARLLNNQAEFVRLVKQNNASAVRLTQLYGPERTEVLRAKDPDALARQAESLFKAVAEKFSDVSQVQSQVRFEAIQNEYQHAQQQFRAAYSKATTDDERRKTAESRPDAKKYLPRMMQLAEWAPDDPAAVDALIWVVDFGGQTKEAERAIERLARDHAQDPKVRQISGRLVHRWSPATERLLRAIVEKSPDRAVQGQASFALAQSLKNEARLARLVKQDQEVAARITQLDGPERTEALRAEDPDALERRAEPMFEAVTEKFGDVNYRRSGGDLAKAAGAELYELRNLGVGKTAPEISGEDLSGRPMKLSDYRGKVVVLDFWGDW
jgi:hypothetical protein